MCSFCFESIRSPATFHAFMFLNTEVEMEPTGNLFMIVSLVSIRIMSDYAVIHDLILLCYNNFCSIVEYENLS